MLIRRCAGAAPLRARRATREAAHDLRETDARGVGHAPMPQNGKVEDLALDGDGPACPACGAEMSADGVDTAAGLESCHRCPCCKLVIVIPGLWPE